MLEILHMFQVTRLHQPEQCDYDSVEDCPEPASYKILLITKDMYGHNSLCEGHLRKTCPDIELTRNMPGDYLDLNEGRR